MTGNPRTANGAKRRALTRWLRAQGRPCHICGRPIDYSLTTYVDPKDGRTKPHPMRFEVDEIVPVSKGGSPYDRDNVDAAHRICNQRRSNRPVWYAKAKAKRPYNRTFPTLEGHGSDHGPAPAHDGDIRAAIRDTLETREAETSQEW